MSEECLASLKCSCLSGLREDGGEWFRGYALNAEKTALRVGAATLISSNLLALRVQSLMVTSLVRASGKNRFAITKSAERAHRNFLQDLFTK